MAPNAPTCTTTAEFASQLRDVAVSLALPETEDNWEKIARSIQKTTALCRGGAYELDPEYVTALKTNYKVINTSMLSERTRLSGTAIELISVTAEHLGSRFEPLVQLFVPAVLRVLTRPNKVFVTRAQTCLLQVIEYCHLPSIVPHLREAVKDKSQALRLGAIEATLHLLNHFERQLLDVRVTSSTLVSRHRGNAEDIESIIRDTACDANPSVRQVSRATFEKYSDSWPDRVAAFTAPMTPTTIKYLNFKGEGSKTSSKNQVDTAKSRAAPAPPKAAPVTHTLRVKPSKGRLVQVSNGAARKEDPGTYAASRPQSQASQRDAEYDAPPVTRAGPSRPTFRNMAPSETQDVPFRAGPTRPAQTVFRATTAAPASNPVPPASSAYNRPPSRAARQRSAAVAPPDSIGTIAAQSTRPVPPPSVQPTRSDLTSPPLPSSVPASGFTRVERPQAPRAPELGPVRPAAPARTGSLWDAPSRPMRNPTVQVEGAMSVKAKFQPKPMSSHASKRKEVKGDTETPETKSDGQETATDLETVSAPPQVDELVPVPANEALDVTAPPRPSSAASNVVPSTSQSQSEASDAGPSTPAINMKHPVVVTRKAVPPPGQVQGFAPTRRRAGLAEPTLSQLAKQRPHKVFVTMPKKLEASLAPVKKATTSQLNHQPERRIPTANSRNRDLGHKERPTKETEKVDTTRPTPVGLNEVALPDVGPEKASIILKPQPQNLSPARPTIPSKRRLEAPTDETPRVPRGTRPTTAEGQPQLPPLLDLDLTIVLPPTAQTVCGILKEAQASQESDLMDFDMSVILPADRFAPMATSGGAFAVHRDGTLEDCPPVAIHVRTPAGGKTTLKDTCKAGKQIEEKLILSERELNIMLSP